jgi:hypothetical protein
LGQLDVFRRPDLLPALKGEAFSCKGGADLEAQEGSDKV